MNEINGMWQAAMNEQAMLTDAYATISSQLDYIERLRVALHSLTDGYKYPSDVVQIARAALAGTAVQPSAGMSLDETRFRAALSMVGMMYPTDVFPPNGASQDCKSAKMVRLTLDNVWREYEKLKEAEAECTADPTSQPSAVRKYQAFDDWFNEQEGFALRSERLYEDFKHATPAQIIALGTWVRAAFDAGRKAEQPPCHECDGQGTRVLWDDTKNEYGLTPCPDCNATGRATDPTSPTCDTQASPSS